MFVANHEKAEMNIRSQSINIRIDLETVLEQYAASSWNNVPLTFRLPIVQLLRRILSLDQIENFLNSHPGVRGMNLLDDIFEYLDVSFLVSSREIEHVPATGRVVCVCNHPLGGLDGLVLLKVLLEVRPDVRIVANNVLLALEGLSDLFLPVDIFSGTNTKTDILRIDEALEQNEAVLFFPAAEVSRMSVRGVTDTRWHNGALRFAQRHQAPILPMYVGAKNSAVFYGMSFISKKLSTFLLPHEMLRKNKKPVRLHIGELIPYSAFSQLHAKAATKLMRKQVETLPLGKKGPFRTERGIARPIERRILRRELDAAMYLGSPAPYKRLYLAEAKGSPSVVREIARLREVTFRYVGEGTGKRLDKDR
jgi:putative hemolysin